LVDFLAQKCKLELQERHHEPIVKCVATGGLSSLVGQECSAIDDLDRDLTLKGLWILFQRNQVA